MSSEDISDSGGSFSLKSQESDFKSKSDSIFGGLSCLEAKHTAKVNARKRFSRDSEDKYFKDDPDVTDVNPPDAKAERSDVATHRSPSGPERSFARPRGRAPRQRHVPDFKAHPERWTSYDLTDVSKHDLSDRGNTSAAMDFLRNQRKEKFSTELSKCTQDDMDTNEKIVFHKPALRSEVDSMETEIETSNTPKIAEYVVGEKKARAAKPRQGPVAAGEAVGLGHLAESPSDDAAPPEDRTSSAQVSGASGDASQAGMIDSAVIVSKLEETVSFKKTKRGKKNMRSKHSDDGHESDE